MSHSMKKRKYFAGLFLAAALLTFAGGEVSAKGTDGGTVEIPVSQTFEIENQGDAAPADTFTYQFTAADSTAPMPAGSKEDGYTFELKGNEKDTLPPISYTHAGVYTYYAEQVVAGEEEGYTYDRQTYTVKVYVENAQEGLISSVVVLHQNGEKEADISFSNSWKGNAVNKTEEKPESGEEDPRSTAKVKTGSVKTGDETQIFWYVAVLAISAAGISVSLWKKKRS